MDDAAKFVTRIEPRLSRDGKIGELAVQRKDGSTAYLHFAMEDAGAIALGVEHAVATLFERQREVIKGADPRLFFAMRPRHARFQGGFADGKPIVSATLETGARMDFAVAPGDIAALIDWLKSLREGAKAQPAPN